MLLEIINFAEQFEYEKEHCHQVAHLALRLFEELTPLHELENKEKSLLEAASLLHDIGWVNGRERHHKTSRDLILKAEKFPFNSKDKMMVALIARYHRKAFPEDAHKYFCDLSEESKRTVRILASFLRVADGLDRRHIASVKDLHCEILPRKIILGIQSPDFPEMDRLAGKKKADLLEKTFEREIIIE